MAATNQQTAIGVVSATRGEVFAKGADGQLRRLAVGDTIFEGDVIITANGSSAEVTPFDGPAFNVAEQQTVAVDSQVASTAPAQDPTASSLAPLGSTEAAKVIQAVGVQDFNALLVEEAAAAGLTGGDGADGGHNFVDLMRIVEAVPTVNYNFPANLSGSAPLLEGQPPVPTTNTTTSPVSIGVGIVSNGDVNETANPSFTITISQALDRDLTVTLSNDQTVTIKAGETSAQYTVAAQGDDVYVDAGSVTVGIASASVAGASFEQLVISPATATAQVSDTIDPVTVSIASNGNVSEAQAASFTLSVSQALDRDLTVTLSNEQTVTIKAGETSAQYTVAAQGDDVYVDAGSVTVGIASASVAGASFEQLVISPATATAQVSDTIDMTTVNLTASASSVAEGGTVTYTATVDYAPQSDLVLTLSNNSTITIKANQLSGSSEPVTMPSLSANTSVIVGISETNGGGNYEHLDTSATVTVLVVDSLPGSPVNDTITVEEESIPGIGGNNETNDGYSYLATGTFANNAVWGGDGFGGIVSVNGVSTVDGNGNITAIDSKGTLVVNVNSGNYTYTLNHNVLEAGAGENTQTAPSLTIVARDGDGDPISFQLLVSVVDDVPTFTHIDNAIAANSVGTLTGHHNLAFGADGEGSINLSALTNVTGLTYSSAVHNADGSTTISAGTNGSTSSFFSLTINPDGTYVFDLKDPRPDVTKTANFGSFQGSQAVTTLTLGSGTDAITFTGLNGDKIKPTSAGFGINDGNLNPGDDFLFSVAGNSVDSVTFSIKQQSSTPFKIQWTTDTGETGTQTFATDGNMTIDPASDFKTISFHTIDGNAKVDQFSYSQNLLPENQMLQFSVSGTDADNDTSSAQTLNVTLLGGVMGADINGTGGDDAIMGTSAGEKILGGIGDDVLTGGLGGDTLTGGLGADTFKWNLGDATGNPVDKITDFNISQGDSLNLKDLLAGEHSAVAGNLDTFLVFQKSGADTVLTIDSNGAASGGDIQKITFVNTDLFGQASVATSSDLITKLLANGNLKTDI